MRKIQNAFAILGRLKENGSGAITEQDARGAILVVQNRTHYIASDHDHFSVRTGAYKLRSNCKGVCKTGAGCGQIEAPGTLGAQAVLHQTSSRGKEHVGRDASYDNQVDFSRSVFVFSRSSLAASVARCELAVPASAMCRSRIPVRLRIHSSLVSTNFSRSALVSTLGGT